MPPRTKFRIDRLVSVGVARAMSIRRHHPQAGRLPILMYHGINSSLGSRHPYYETNTSASVFRSHMQILAQGSYRTLGLGTAVQEISSGGKASRQVAITFDDGHRDFYDTALPILAEFGFTATMFIVTGFTGDQRDFTNGKQYMTWSEVRELPKYGIRIGSHSASHGKLSEMSPSRVEDEVRRSKETLEDKLGSPVESFAYPFAFPEGDRRFLRHLRECLQKHAYKNGVSTVIGMASGRSDPYFLPRLPLNTYDDEVFFQVKLEGGYEWLHALQYAKKVYAGRLR